MPETVLRRIWQAMERWRWRAVALAVTMLLAIAVFSWFGVSTPIGQQSSHSCPAPKLATRAWSPFARRF